MTRTRDDPAMAGKLKEPMTITDHRQQLVCILPVGFHFDDERWDRLWERFGETGETLTHDELRALFPEEPTLQHIDMKGDGDRG